MIGKNKIFFFFLILLYEELLILNIYLVWFKFIIKCLKRLILICYVNLLRLLKYVYNLMFGLFLYGVVIGGVKVGVERRLLKGGE